MPTIAYQLYCSRNFPPLGDTLKMLAGSGYKAVEGYGGLYGALGELKAGLDATGLAMPSGHFGLDMVEDEPARAIEVAKTLGIKSIFVPYIVADKRPGDAAGWSAFGRRLAEAGKPMQDAGFGFGWHNHDFELADLGGGVTPLDLIAEAGVDLELDLGWVRVAGHDPVAWIRKYAGRIKAVHVKDIAPDGTAADEDGWADVGHGIIDWAPVKAALDAAHVDHFVIEHDNPKDHTRFATRSLASVKAW
jgi:sugar phosphate isomerase/epimerase